MANKTSCDICGDEAITEITVNGKTLTETKLDVCESCFAEFKAILRKFTKQDEVIVK